MAIGSSLYLSFNFLTESKLFAVLYVLRMSPLQYCNLQNFFRKSFLWKHYMSNENKPFNFVFVFMSKRNWYLVFSLLLILNQYFWNMFFCSLTTHQVKSSLHFLNFWVSSTSNQIKSKNYKQTCRLMDRRPQFGIYLPFYPIHKLTHSNTHTHRNSRTRTVFLKMCRRTIQLL
jgi:hypothetical protein